MFQLTEMPPVTLSEVADLTPPSPLITSVSPSQEDLETQKRKTASAIVTSGALTLVRNIFLGENIFIIFNVQAILAAALVTASFLMSPVIEDVFGESNSVLIQENSLKLLIKFWCETYLCSIIKFFSYFSEGQTFW